MSDATPLADVSAKLPRRFRRLRIAVSVFFGALTVALCVFWVRSYRFRDEMNYRYWPSRVFEIVSMESRLEFVNGDPISDWPHRFNSHANGEWDSYRMSHPRGFSGGNTVGTPFRVTIPHYAVIIMAAALSAALWLNRIPRRVSLRTMLIVMTVVALVLGLVGYTVR